MLPLKDLRLMDSSLKISYQYAAAVKKLMLGINKKGIDIKTVNIECH